MLAITIAITIPITIIVIAATRVLDLVVYVMGEEDPFIKIGTRIIEFASLPVCVMCMFILSYLSHLCQIGGRD